MPRPAPLWRSLGAIADRLQGAEALALASDLDGTLSPLAPRPGDAALPARAHAALRRLVRTSGCAVAVISGRSLDDLRRQVRLGGVFLAGASGFETLGPAGRRRAHVPRGRALSAGLRATLGDWCRRFPGTLFEDKGPTLALHYRALAPARRAAFAAGVRRRLAAARPRARLVRGRMVFEIQPALRWDKGTVLALWLDGRPDALPVFLGDDQVDEPAHALVRRRGGVSVAVDRRVSRAEFGIADSAEAARFLEWLAREWRECRGRSMVTPEPIRRRRAPARRLQGRMR